MKKLLLVSLFFVFIFGFAATALAVVHVNGYFRKNGTYVAPHYRSDPNSTPLDNWSYPGNTNPYTGKTATGNPDTYLKNYNYPSTYTPPTPTYTLPTSTCISSVSYPGYYFSGSNWYYDSACTRVYVPNNSSTTYTPTTPATPTITCQNNAYLGADNICHCLAGYTLDNSVCVENAQYCKSKLGENSYVNNGVCYCNTGYISINHTCVTYNDACQGQMGINSHGDKDYCYCNDGYILNSDKTKCIQDPSIQTLLDKIADLQKQINDILNKKK